MTKQTAILLLSFYIVISWSCSKGSGGSEPQTFPVATIVSASAERSTSGSSVNFPVSLSASTTSDVTIHYTTVDGTAEANTDYAPVTGTLTIAAGSKSGTIKVDITADSLRRPDQYFSLQLSDPANCTLKLNKVAGTIINANGLYFPVDNTGYSTPEAYTGYTLAWSDEFDENEVSNANWSFESGNNNGWGNNELENYTNRTQNAFVSTGNLIIEARQEDYQGSQYTSARMITKNKKVFKFGRVDIRAKLPSTKGIWPALWMLGNNIDAAGWPACGEIDIMELLGQEPNKVYGTIHWGASTALHDSKGSNYVLTPGSFDQQFHVFSMIWEQDKIKLLIDDVQFFEGTSIDALGSIYPFNNDFFFIFNIAVGGNWPGAPDATTVFPQRMVVDYVRVFQK